MTQPVSLCRISFAFQRPVVQWQHNQGITSIGIAGCAWTASSGCPRDLLGTVDRDLSSHRAKGVERQCLWWRGLRWSIELWGGEGRAASETKEPQAVTCWF